jgi:hypothetical protein
MFACVPAMSAQDNVEKPDLKFGFIKLTDCAPVVIATKLGSFEAAGRYVTLETQADCGNALDQLVTGELNGAHVFAGASRGTLASELKVNEAALPGRISMQREKTEAAGDFPPTHHGVANATTSSHVASMCYEFRASAFLHR